MKLICPECRRENEAERIYCHDCGARLDRSSLAKIAPTGEDAKETQRRLRTMLDPQRAKMRLMFFNISKLILGAFAAAAVIQMVLPPDVPPRTKSVVSAADQSGHRERSYDPGARRCNTPRRR